MSIYAIGVDTTGIQAAWAAVFPDYYESNELPTKAKRSFCDVIDSYIYSDTRLLPLPRNELGKANPLMNLWNSGDVAKPLPQAAQHVLDLEVLDAIVADLKRDAQDFTNDVEGWIRFQFSPRVSEEYLSRVGGQSNRAYDLIAEQVPTAIRLLEQSELSRVRDLLLAVPLSSLHEDSVRIARVKKDVYALSYWLSHLIRGRKYAERLSDAEACYRPHWIRCPVAYNARLDEIHGHEVRQQVPWGDILYHCIDKGLLRRDPSLLIDAITSIRESRVRGDDNIEAEDETERTKARIRVLEKAGIYGKYRDDPFFRKAPSEIANILTAIPGLGKPFRHYFPSNKSPGQTSTCRKCRCERNAAFVFQALQEDILRSAC